jgi:hypothetical protein
LGGEDNLVEIYRNQGRQDQIRVLESMPFEIQGLLAEFAQQDERNRELQEAKEKHAHGIR